MVDGGDRANRADRADRSDRNARADGGTHTPPTAVAVVRVGGSRLIELSGRGVTKLTELTELSGGRVTELTELTELTKATEWIVAHTAPLPLLWSMSVEAD